MTMTLSLLYEHCFGQEDIFRCEHRPHYCDKTRRGKFKVGRKTQRKRVIAKLKAMNAWLQSVRNIPPEKWWPIVAAKLRGHYQYYGVSGNFTCIRRFYFQVQRMVLKWMNRRNQKKSMDLPHFWVYLARHPLPEPRIVRNFYILYVC